MQAAQASGNVDSSKTALNWSAASWLVTAIAGQWAFAGYIIVFFCVPALSGHIADWNRQVLLSQPPVVHGQALNTIAFGTHAIGAGIIFFTGALQLIPFVRNRFRIFHRWNGRVFVFLVLMLSLAGFYLTWVRGPAPSNIHELATSANGLIIIWFAFYAIRSAMKRSFANHQRWAIRLYLVSNAQWFLRIGGFGYFLTAQSLGIDVPLDSWFFAFWTWGCFLVPVIVAELYFWAQNTHCKSVGLTVAALLIMCAVFTAIGSFVFTMFSIELIAGNVTL